MKKTLIFIFLFIAAINTFAQGTKDGSSRTQLYMFQETPFETSVILNAVDVNSNKFSYCNLKYQYTSKEGKPVYVIYDPINIPAAYAINLDQYVNKKVKLIGKYITFEYIIEQTTSSPSKSNPNPCRENALYVTAVEAL